MSEKLKLSTKAQLALQLLENWENKNTVYNFEKIYGAGYFHEPRITNCIYLMNLEDDFKAVINKQFYEIAETGDGGTYALWNYPELQSEPPVIYFETDGDFKMVAPSLEAFASMFSLDEYLEEAYVSFEDIYEYYDLEDEEEAERLFIKAFKQYQKKISSLFDVKTLEEYRIEMNQHKNFKDWYKYIEKNGKDSKGKIGRNYHDEIEEHYEKNLTIYEETKVDLLAEISKKPTGNLYFKLAENEENLIKINHDQRDIYLEKGLEIEPNNIALLKKYAEQTKHFKAKKAIELYTRLIKISPNPKEFYSDIAYAYRNDNQPLKALEFYQKDIIENPISYGTYSQDYIIDICKELKSKDATNILEETLSSVVNKNTYLVLYQLYFKQKNYKKALEHGLNYIKLSNERTYYYISKALGSNLEEEIIKNIKIVKNAIDKV